MGYIAFLKPRNLKDKITARLDGGLFCHCELMIAQNDDGTWQTISSLPKVGVRSRNVTLNGSDWVKVPVDVDVEFCKAWYQVNQGKGYDYIGTIGTRIDIVTGSKQKYNCVEAIAEMLKLPKPHRWGLMDLYNHVKR